MFILLQSSLKDDQLLLDSFACKVVNISYAAVTVNGLSLYSPSSETCVYGGMYCMAARVAICQQGFEAKNTMCLET